MEFRVDGIIAVIAIDRPGKGRAEWRLTAKSEADAVRIVTKAIKPGATVTVVTAVPKFVEV